MKENKILIVKGTCGLGNRLMSLANALEYCEKTGRRIYVDWCDGMFSAKGENAFNYYFEIKNFEWEKSLEICMDKKVSFYPDVARNLPDNFVLDEFFHTSSANKRNSKILEKIIHFGSGIAHQLLSEDYFKYYFVLWHRWELLDCYQDIKSHKWGGNKFCLGGDLPMARKEDVILFADFCPGFDKKYLKNICLKDEIKKEIESFSKKHDLRHGVVGMHIRCTDKGFEGNLDQIFRKVRCFMQEHNAKRLFLCTDQTEILKLAKEYFGENLLLYHKYLPKLPNNGNQGIHTWAAEQEDEQMKLQMYHDAVMEMYLLAETEYLLCQGNSTFSIVSKNLRNGMCVDWQKKIWE